MSEVTEMSDDEQAGESPSLSARKPIFMLLLTGLYLIAVVCSRMFLSDIEDAASIGLDVVNIITLFATVVLLLLWSAWFLLFSRWKWRNRIIAVSALFGLPLAFFSLFRPVGGGDLDFVRFRPIWAKQSPPPVIDTNVEGISIDLTTETENDFSRFLGPDQNGCLPTQVDVQQFEQSEIIWKQSIGLGWPGFVARNGYAVTMEQRGDLECVTCYVIESGSLAWIYEHSARHRDALNLGHVGPRSTPTIHEGKVYAVGAVGNLVCLDGSNGKVIWQVDLNTTLGLELSEALDSEGLKYQYEKDSSLAWGRSGSPLIVGDLLVVPGGGPRDGETSTLLAFDRKTGDLVWRGGDEPIAYGSPIIATLADTPQILMTAEAKTMSFDPKTGTVLWEIERNGQSDAEANTSQVTPIAPFQLLVTKGYPGGGGELIRLSPGPEGGLAYTSVWRSPQVLKTKLTSPVLHEGHAYAISNGFMECTRLEDGARIWKRRGRFGHGQILKLSDKILIHSESGNLHLIDASPDGYNEYGSLKTIDGICWNTLCLYGNRLLVRSDIEAACVELK